MKPTVLYGPVNHGLTMTRLSLLRHLAFCGLLALLSIIVVRIMIHVRILDHPTARKAHSAATPKGGGVGIVVSFLVGIAVLYSYASFSRIADPYFTGVIVASTGMAYVAFLDDLHDWPFFIKMIAQVSAAGAALYSGLFVQVYRLPYFGPIDLHWWGAVLTLFWILFATNAMNFIDGLNGLVAGVIILSCAFLAAIGASQGAWFLYFTALLLGSGTAGFFPFNFPRASIFMGDVGSQFCGFVLAVLGIAASRFDRLPMSFVLVPVLLFGIEFDVAFTLVRRMIMMQPITSGHRGHLYQVAHRSGMPASLVSVTQWCFVLFNGVCCLVFINAASAAKPMILLLPLLPQICWTAYVWRRATRAQISAW